MPTVYTRASRFITALTVSASTCRSGSATVIRTPSTKLTKSNNHSFFCRERPAPTWVPIGVIARSAPMLNIPIPKISSTALMEKVISSTAEKLNHGSKDMAYTIKVIGSADRSASLILKRNSFICVTFHKFSYSITEKAEYSKGKTQNLHFPHLFCERCLPADSLRFFVSFCPYVP